MKEKKKVYYAISYEGLTFSTSRKKPYWREYVIMAPNKRERDSMFKQVPDEKELARIVRRNESGVRNYRKLNLVVQKSDIPPDYIGSPADIITRIGDKK